MNGKILRVDLLRTTDSGKQIVAGSFLNKETDVIYQSLLAGEPEMKNMAAEVLREGIFDGDSGKRVMPSETIAFLELLPFHFNSAYLRALVVFA